MRTVDQGQGPFDFDQIVYDMVMADDFDQKIYDMVMADPRVELIHHEASNIDSWMVASFVFKIQRYISHTLALGIPAYAMLSGSDLNTSIAAFAGALYASLITYLVDRYNQNRAKEHYHEAATQYNDLPQKIRKYAFLNPNILSTLTPCSLAERLGKCPHPFSFFSQKRMANNTLTKRLQGYQNQKDENEPQ